MNKIKLLIGILILISCISCNKDFLDKQSYEKISTGTFYKTSSDAQQALTAVYDVTQRDTWNAPILVSECMSDDCSGGGGVTDDLKPMEFNQFYAVDQDLADPNWQNNYLGIYRANLLLENISKVNWLPGEDGLLAQYTSEARFLRAYFYFNLAKLFGHIPLVTKTLTPSEAYPAQANPEDVYKFIAEDLVYAIKNLPATPYPSINPANYGHATKWAAEAYLARVWLFYTGYYKKTDIAGMVAKSDVTGYIDDVIANGGFGLVEKFTDLWPYAGATYAGKDNKETVFSIKYTVAGHGDFNLNDGNRWQVSVGPRNTSYPPYAKGWGSYTVNPSLYNAFDTTDTRRDGTIVNWDKKLGVGKYNSSDQREYTGFGWRKYCPLAGSKSATNAEALGGSFMIDNYDDLLVVRYADVLLMAAELHLGDGKDLLYFNQVRNRAFQDNNHSKTSLTLQDIMDERRFELALEGSRYFDLLRQGLDVAKTTIETNSVQSSTYPVTFPSDKGFDGFLKIPETQVNLSNGTLKQSDYWESAASTSPTH
jgi:starch-binding outer membrane protein, SusD/RagB family